MVVFSVPGHIPSITTPPSLRPIGLCFGNHLTPAVIAWALLQHNTTTSHPLQGIN